MSREKIKQRIEKIRVGQAPGKVGFGGTGRDITLISMKHAVAINTRAAPFEQMVDKGWLASSRDVGNAAMLRFSVCMRCRELWDGSGISAIRANTYEPTVSGGGPGNTIADYRLDCMNKVAAIKTSMPKEYSALFEKVIINDHWAWNAAASTRPPVIGQLLRAIDYAAIALGYITDEEFKRRWKTAPSRRPGRR